ncbi:MAG TPA: hypothetical protein VK762_06310 [Polyangiaceae bacterium]|jgi:hypothetical protein|nr:hypothetical protein [Polyangiaceae bacterium]
MSERRRISRLAMLALVGAIECASAPCGAQADHAASRTIGDATFMLPAWAESAFVLTEFGFRQDIEYESIPHFPVASLGTYNLSWVQFQETVDVAVRLTSFLGVYAEGAASGALGPDTASLLFQGGGLDYGGKGGAVLRLYRNEASGSQVALRLYGGGDGGRTLDLIDFFGAFGIRAARGLQNAVSQTSDVSQLPAKLTNEAIALADTDYSTIAFYRSSSVLTGTSLHYAQALVGPLTVQLSVALERTWGQQRPYDLSLQDFAKLSTTDTTITLDSVLSCDFGRWSVPLGASAEYAGSKTYRSLNGGSVYIPSTHDIGGGLYFTGRRGVEIGALLFTRRNLKADSGFETPESSAKPVGYVGSLVFRALW